MPIYGESELEDFESVIREAGLERSDFEIESIDDTQPTDGIYPITGRVTIKRKSTDREKTYKAGHGSMWPVEFHDDLAAGVFG